MTVEETKKLIAQYASGKQAEFILLYAETSGGLVGVKDGNFIFGNGVPLSIKQKSLFERWDEEAEFIKERGGYFV